MAKNILEACVKSKDAFYSRNSNLTVYTYKMKDAKILNCDSKLSEYKSFPDVRAFRLLNDK